MTLLLDTHAYLWFWWADPQLSAPATAAICDPSNRKLISPASSWEVAMTPAELQKLVADSKGEEESQRVPCQRPRTVRPNLQGASRCGRDAEDLA